ncbi:MAG: hypothetical protein JXQ90_00715 [Cyclobacteriaceae bacterium]
MGISAYQVVKLAQKEIDVLSETDFIKTKRNISEKITKELNVLAHDISSQINWQSHRLFSNCNKSHKVSKGENLEGLPYFVLDLPNHYKKDDICAFRTVVWWGKLISFNLHLAGSSLNAIKSFEPLDTHNDLKICINPSPWLHHNTADNFVEANKSNIKERINNAEFLKLTFIHPIEQINELSKLGFSAFQYYYKYFSHKE